MQQKKSSLGKNTLFNLIKNISAIAFPLITFPYISRVLGVENVGKINFGNSIVSYISLLATVGISTYAIRECSKVKDDREKLGEISSQILSFNVVTTIIAYIVFFILLFNWNKLTTYRTLLLIQVLSVLFTTIGADWLNAAMEDFRYITIRTVFFQIVSLVMMFLFVRHPEDYLIYAVIGIVSSSGSNIANVFYRKKYCDTKLVFKIEWRKHLKPVLLFFAIAISQQIYLNIDTTMLGVFKGDYEVGLYGTATKIYSIVNMVIVSLNQVTLPRMSHAYAKKDYEEINAVYRYAASIIVTVGLPCIVGILILAPNIITIIAGRDYIGAALALRILMIPLVFSSLVGLIGGLLFVPSGRENISLNICFVAAIVNFITNLILIPRFGLYAAAATTGLAEIVSFVMCLPHIEKSIVLKEKKDIFLGPVVGVLAFGLVDLIILKLIKMDIIATCSSIIISMIIYVLLQLIIGNTLLESIILKIRKSSGDIAS